MDGVFVGSGIFKSEDPIKRAEAIVSAVTHYNNPLKLAEFSENLGEAMFGVGNLKTVESYSIREGGNMK